MMATRKAAAPAEARGAVKKAAVKKAAVKKAAGKKAGASVGASSGGDYTKPELRERIKKEVMAGDKGGRAGQWSARKAQMVAHEYGAEGGGYKHPRNAAQTSLKDWGDEHWHTADGKQAVQGEETHRYLPDEAWKELSAKEKDATDAKKVEGSRQGKQFVANTGVAAKARKRVVERKADV